MVGKKVSLKRFAALSAMLTVITMTLFFNMYEPWQLIGSELIPDGSFSTSAATNGWTGWSQRARLTTDGGFNGTSGVELTTRSNKNGVLRFTVYNLSPIPALRISMRAATKNVVRGKQSFFLPRTAVSFHDAHGQTIPERKNTLFEIMKTSPWRHYEEFFPIPEGAEYANLHIQNLGADGIMQVDDVSIIPVCERPDAPWWKLFFGTLWFSAFILCLVALRPWKRRYGFLIMATLFAIMVGISLPGKILDGSIGKAARAVNDLIPKKVPVVQPPTLTVQSALAQTAAPKPSKQPEEISIIPSPGIIIELAHLLGHSVLFSLLALFCALSWMTAPALKRAITVFACLTFFAAATEVLQYIPADRSAGLGDLRVDTVGMAVAVAAAFALRRIQRLINRD